MTCLQPVLNLFMTYSRLVHNSILTHSCVVQGSYSQDACEYKRQGSAPCSGLTGSSCANECQPTFKGLIFGQSHLQIPLILEKIMPGVAQRAVRQCIAPNEFALDRSTCFSNSSFHTISGTYTRCPTQTIKTL